MAMQGYTAVPPRIGKLKGEIFKHAVPRECLVRAGRQVQMPKNNSDTYVARRFLPYGATDLDTCYRVTHVLRKTKSEIIKLQQAGFYRDFPLPDPDKSKTDIQQAKDKETGFSDINDDRYTLYESHVDLVVKSDPYTNFSIRQMPCPFVKP